MQSYKQVTAYQQTNTKHKKLIFIILPAPIVKLPKVQKFHWPPSSSINISHPSVTKTGKEHEFVLIVIYQQRAQTFQYRETKTVIITSIFFTFAKFMWKLPSTFQNLKKNVVSDKNHNKLIGFGYEVLNQLLNEQLNSSLSKTHFSIANKEANSALKKISLGFHT